MSKKVAAFISFMCIFMIWPVKAYAIGFTIATAMGLTAATAAGGVGLTGVGLAVGAGITAGTVFGGAKMLGGALKTPSAPALPALPKTPSTADATAKAKEESLNKRRAISRNQTVRTNPMGLTPADKSDLNLKTLTGA